MPRSKRTSGPPKAAIGTADVDDVALAENISEQLVSPTPRYIRPSLPSTTSYAGPFPESLGRSSTIVPGASARGSRVRSRTSTISYTPPLPPVMSRENSHEDLTSHLASSLPTNSTVGRKSSKSVSNSNSRPNLGTLPQRTYSYHTPSASASAAVTPIPSLLTSPTDSTTPNTRLKRRISTPVLAPERPDGEKEERRRKDNERTRARSTSTSVVVPELILEPAQSEETETYAAGPSSLHRPEGPSGTSPNTPWAPIFITPASPSGSDSSSSNARLETFPYAPPTISTDKSILAAVYDFGESSILRLSRLVRPSASHHSRRRRGSDEDSEKGLQSEEETSHDSTASNDTSRTSEDSLRRNGKYWGIWQSTEEDEDGGYFSLPPTPSEEKAESSLADFEAALDRPLGTLPTPALSTRSLSRGGSKRRRPVVEEGEAREGWLATVINVWSNLGTGRRSGGKLGEVIKELGWTVALLVGLFVLTAATVLWILQAMPISRLKHIPKSTTDLQLLSAEIRTYMASSPVGWYHTVGVLTLVGCWKHAWSVPGAVVLNILVGSVLEPMPALLLLTVITATGSLFSYLLSRPLAPLIAVLFPKPLSLVRAALAPNQIPHSPSTTASVTDEKVTAIQVSSNPATPPIGSEGSTSIWRRLLIMRAMGFVPWSGMNVACGVVNVDWKIFWLTTAAGSASWSYVTASVGNILSRLAIPPAALESGASGDMIDGESLTSLLRDPVLIAKLVFLSGMTLLPVVLKRRKVTAETAEGEDAVPSGLATPTQSYSPTSPSSPLAKSLARFTPTPAAFDLLSFGRTAVRQGVRVALGSARGAVSAVRRVVG